jgi:hypothetical protein
MCEKFREQKGEVEPSEEEIEEWVEHYPTRRRQEARRCLEQWKSGECSPAFLSRFQNVVDKKLNQTCSMFAKYNETLGLKVGRVGNVGVKPRVIANPPIMFQLLTQPTVKKAQKRHFQVRLNDSGLDFDFNSASGWTSEQLDEWMEKALTGGSGVWVVAMGDDSVVVDNQLGLVFEIDYSQFDQSQQGIYIELDLRMLQAMGVGKRVLRLLRALARARMRKRYTKTNLCITFKAFDMVRKSGSPDTSFSNTTKNWVIIMAGYSLWRKKEYSGHLFDNFKALGVKATGQVFPMTLISHVSFLRGLWWPGEDGSLHWSYVPAMALKVTKVSRVCTIKEYRQLAFGIAHSFGQVPEDLPVLGVVLKKLKELGQEPPDEELLDEVMPWRKHRPHVKPFSLDREAALQITCRRYETSVREIEELEQQITEIKQLPWFLGHPLWMKLREGDY